MTLGQTTYEDYLKAFKKRKGSTRGALTRYAWERSRQLLPTMERAGVKRGPIAKRYKQQGDILQQWINFLNRVRGAGR
jgi:hypothetical protein